jgi:hypothetical protein
MQKELILEERKKKSAVDTSETNGNGTKITKENQDNITPFMDKITTRIIKTTGVGQ